MVWGWLKRVVQPVVRVMAPVLRPIVRVMRPVFKVLGPIAVIIDLGLAAYEITKAVIDRINRKRDEENSIRNLKEEVEKLKYERESVEHRVDEARRNGEEIEAIVEKWLTTVNGLLQDYNFLQSHPNNQKAIELYQKVVKIRQEGNFAKVSYRRPSAAAPARPIEDSEAFVTDKDGKDYESFESRMLISKKIVESLMDAEVHLIGLYGIGGVGKTTLVKQVASVVREDGVFELVVLATVTPILDVRVVQQEIADGLDFKIDADSPHVRAARLSERIKKEEKVLVILDDVCEKIKLEDVGIPFGNNHKGCKILMVSRDENILWEMGVLRDFHLQVLNNDESWQLFKKKAVNAKDPDIQPIAIEVTRRCSGLPILIAVVASALRNKMLSQWKDALDRLKQLDNDEMGNQVESVLELSYSFLKGDEIKSLFLLCAQIYPYNISINDLLKYCVGLGLFKQSNSIEGARNILHKLLQVLKGSCFLLQGDTDERVKMHDVVHNFAVSFASRNHQAFIAQYNSKVKEWPAKDELQQYTSISLPYCKISEFPEAMECPKLQSFLLFGTDYSPKIPDNFFSGMKEVRVLDLTRMNLSLLPSSLQFIQNVQTLCLDFCILEDIAAIGELKKLQVLSIIGSTVTQLPREIGKLTRLQLLDLSKCTRLEVIQPNVLSSLTQLEDLYMGNSFVKWEGEADSGQRNNASLAELKHLPDLINLELQIIDAKLLPRDLFSGKLERFRIFIGDDWDWSGKYKSSRTLKLKLFTSFQFEKVKVLLTRSEELHLHEINGVRSILCELDEQGFRRLKHLHIQNSPDIKYIVESMGMGRYAAFPRLESLFLDYLINLEKICLGQLKTQCFGSLSKLNVRNCNRLKNLFPFSMVRGLVRIEEINVSSCKIMEEFVDEEIGDDSANKEAIKLIQLCAVTFENLPQFTSFSSQLKLSTSSTEITTDDEPLPLFNKKITFPNLADLKLYSVGVKKIWSNQLPELSPYIGKLKTLIIDGCGNLSYLFTSLMVDSLVQLNRLEICNCRAMEEIIAAKGEITKEFLFPKLEFLKLKGLSTLISFCTGNLIACPSLKVLQIASCSLLRTFISKNFISMDMALSKYGQANSILFNEKVSFPKLEELHIINMHQLKMIWHDEIQAGSFCKLKVLNIENCNELLRIFPSEMLRGFQNLESLFVKNCDILEEVFDPQLLMKVKEMDGRASFKLRTLDMRDLPKLKLIWYNSSREIFSFDNLCSVVVWHCLIMKTLFPVSIARNLPQLEELNIDNCGLMEIVSKEEGFGEVPKFVFPRLKLLILWRLQELESFYPGVHTLECPVLERLTIYHCDKLKTFAQEPQDLQETSSKQPLFSFKKVAPNLEELALSSKDISTIMQDQIQADLFHKVNVLQLQCFYDASANFPFHLLRIFQNLRTLVVRHCYFKELFSYGIVREDARTLSQIRYFRLDLLPDMRHIWNQDSTQACQVLENLETLEVWFCHSLINLAPPSVSFQNLTAIDVWNCGEMVNLVASSTAKSLVNLTKMSVRECHMVTEIVSNDGDSSEFHNEIVFSKLASLKLLCLRSLSSFCSSASCSIKFPCLEEVIVTECPNIKVFAQGDLTSPKLQKVCLNEEGDRWCWVKDLNTTIQHLYL